MRKFNINVNGKIYVVEIEETGEAAPVIETPKTAENPKTEAPKPVEAPKAAAGAATVNAPMPGTILDVKVSVGATVKAGDVICILEAMKMENEIVAPQDGTITSVVAKGATVNTGDLLAAMQ